MDSNKIICTKCQKVKRISIPLYQKGPNVSYDLGEQVKVKKEKNEE